MHIPIHPGDQRFLAFQLQGSGLRVSSALLWSDDGAQGLHHGLPVGSGLPAKNWLIVYAYLDDWLIVNSSEAEARRHTDQVVSLLERLGWVLNREKSALVPSQRVVYLGADIDFVAGKAGPSEERVASP